MCQLCTEIVAQYPVKKYTFTLWKSTQGQWHVEYEAGEFIAKRQRQSGRKLTTDRNLRFDEIE